MNSTRSVTPQGARQTESAAGAAFEALSQALRRRASVRQYADKPVSEDLLRELLALAARTQTMGNLQLYSVVVTRDARRKALLAPAHFNQPMVTQAPVVLTVCADFHRTTRWCEERQAHPGYANLLSFLNAATDALLYTQTLSCLAEARGLGLCFLGTTIYQPDQIIDLLQLPRLVMPVATLTLGWPAETPAQSDRLEPAAFVHEETYHDYSAADIDRHYAYKEGLEDNRRFCTINHKATLAQVYTDVRYTREANEQMSATLLRALRRQGFLD